MNSNEKKYRSLSVMPRQWFRLPTIDGYVFREFMIKFSVLLLVFVILFILGDVFNDLSDFLEEKASLYDILLFLLLRLPGNIRFVLPIAVLLGCMWTMATFGKNMEVTAMRASGVSLFRCGLSIFLIGLAATGVNIYFYEALVPYTEREAQVLKEEATKKRDKKQKNQVMSYKSPDLKRGWFFQSFISGNAQRDVQLKIYRPNGTLESEMQIGRALWNASSGWYFEKIQRTEYSDDGVMPKAPELLHSLRFSRTEIPENPEDIANAMKDEEELPALVLWQTVQKTPQMPSKIKSAYMTMFYFRLAFPWSCFLAVFLGIPLATKNERSGSLLAVITAVLLIVVYIVIAQIFLVLGKTERMPPLIAGFAPTLAFIFYGYYKVFYHKA